MKYKVGDRVFHKKTGWGTIRGIRNSCSLQYAVEFDEEFFWGYSCNGLCRDDNGLYVSEFELSTSDSLLNDIRLRLGRDVRELMEVWKRITLWGKVLCIASAMICLPLAVCSCILERLENKVERFINSVPKEVKHIFRIYKE